MTEARTTLVRLTEVTLLLLAAALVAGQLLGQPMLLAFVETGSMSPTMEPGDGFIAVPYGLSGPAEPGDVIVYRATVVEGGGLTTHRVVGVDAGGYVTRGDANPFTDQNGGEPPVQRHQIVAEALQINGRVVVVPGLGKVVQRVHSGLTDVQQQLAVLLGTRSLLGLQGLAYLLFAITLTIYFVGGAREAKKQRRKRQTTRETTIDARLVMVAFAVVLVLGATAAMTIPAGSQEFGVISAEFDSERSDVIPMGESKDQTYRVPNTGLVPTVVFLESGSDQVEIAPREHHLGPRETANATLTLHAPSDTGYYRYYVTEHRYLALLPTSTIRTLYEIHPWLPVVVIDAIIAGTFLALTLPFVGRGRIRDRSRDGASRSLLTRLVR